MSDWYLYIVRCNDGSLYTGISTNVARRLREHQRGGTRGASYLRGRGPIEVVFTRQLPDRAAALRAEYAIKRLEKTQKERLATGSIKLDDVLDTPSRRPADARNRI